MKQTKIGFVITGYKDKNLRAMVDDLKAKTRSEASFAIFDQHAINHRDDFKDIEHFCTYDYKDWDELGGHCKKRSEKINDMMGMDYICLISPDIRLADGWDEVALDFIKSKNNEAIISGNGEVTLTRKNLFELGPEWAPSDKFTLTNFVDRNFVFASADQWRQIEYPTFLNYAGEQEFLSIAFLSQDLEIYSMPSNFVFDSKERSIETKYCIWSKEHNYNIVVEIINCDTLEEFGLKYSGWQAFVNSFNIERGSLKKLPYQTNDVLYDPNKLNIHDVDARRFITGVKALH